MGCWAFVDVCLLAAGIIALVFSIVWKEPNLLMNFILSDAHLKAGLALGICLIVTWAASVVAIVQPNHVTRPLMMLNWLLIGDAIGVLVVGTFIWFYTLQERAEYHTVFSRQSNDIKVAIQDTLKCCGYFNSSDLVVIQAGSFCDNSTFVNGANNASGNFCVGPITAKADFTLNNIFTSIYGFMAIVVLLFLATLCVINKRYEGERFKRIDEKRGGRGFV